MYRPKTQREATVLSIENPNLPVSQTAETVNRALWPPARVLMLRGPVEKTPAPVGLTQGAFAYRRRRPPGRPPRFTRFGAETRGREMLVVDRRGGAVLRRTVR